LTNKTDTKIWFQPDAAEQLKRSVQVAMLSITVKSAE